MRHARLVAALAFSFSITALAPAQQSGLTPRQMMSLRNVTGVYPHPSKDVVAFTRTEPRGPGEQPGGAHNHLYLLEPTASGAARERLLLGGSKSARGVAWDPKGDRITFVDEREGDDHAEVYSMSLAGDDITKVTTTPHGVSSYAWRPDGGAIAFTVTDPLPPLRAAAQEKGFRQRIVDEDFRHVSLWLQERGSSEVRRLTQDQTVFSHEWSPTGTHLAAAIAPHNLVDDRYMFSRLYRIDAASGETELLADNPGKLGAYAWSPDGQTLAYVSAADRNDPHAGTLFVVNATAREPRALTRDFRGMVHELFWMGDDEPMLFATISEGVRSSVAAIDLETGELRQPESLPDIAFTEVVPVGAATAYTVASTGEHPPEVYRLMGDDDGVVQADRLTDSNPWLTDVALGEQQVVRFEARDGVEIEGLLMYPVGYREGELYPLVIVAHGGPESHFSDGWNTSYSSWGQMLCARGYFAWYPNYRSSTGYGVEFAKEDHGDPMGAEFEDHLDAIEHFAKEGLIDSDRVGLGGGSYGGYTAAWAATRHSEHFAAAVSFVPFVDIRTKWYTTDIPYEFYYVHYQEKWPHEQRGFLADRSPLTYAENCRTPLLVLGGTADPRVHPSQPFMLYRAIKFATPTPVRYVQYPGEGHGNRSNVYQYDYALRTLRWFDHYLAAGQGRSAAMPPFDVDYGTWIEGAGNGDEDGAK